MYNSAYMSEKTLFEKIAAHEIPAEIIYEDAHTVAFLDIKPVNQGHTLVIPKKHFENVLEMPEDEIAYLMSTIKKVAEALKTALGAQGVNLIFNNGSIAGQIVFHTHAHVIPRFEGDGLHGWAQGSYEEDQAAGIGEKLRTQLQ